MQTANHDLRAHSSANYGAVIDCWPWMRERPREAARHRQQIREINNDPNFPSK